MKETLVNCTLCLGSRRWRNRKCPRCLGSGRIFINDAPREKVPPPTETTPVVYVLSATCDNCGPCSTDPSKPHRADSFNQTIWCGRCNRGLMTFELSAEPPRIVEAADV